MSSYKDFATHCVEIWTELSLNSVDNKHSGITIDQKTQSLEMAHTYTTKLSCFNNQENQAIIFQILSYKPCRTAKYAAVLLTSDVLSESC